MADQFNSLVPYYKTATDRWPTAKTLKNLYSSLTSCYQSENIGLIEHIRSFIESVCLTILTDFGVTLENSSPSTTEILSEVWKILGFENTRGISKIDKVISGYNKLAEAINEMRNKTGVVSHGKDGFYENLQKENLRSFLLAGDSILCMILSALEGKEPDIRYTREPYERFDHFNHLIDESVICRVTNEEDEKIIILDFINEQSDNNIQLRIEPSRALFSLDREAYIEFIEVSTPNIGSHGLKDKVLIPLPQKTQKKAVKKTEALQLRDVINRKEYDGIYKDYFTELTNYLKSLIPLEELIDHSHLAISILSLLEKYQYPEWKIREVLIANLKVKTKRILLFYDMTNIDENLLNKIYYWLKVNIVKSE